MAHVLIVDDERSTLDSMALSIRGIGGHRTTTALSATDALVKTAQDEPQVAVLDYRLQDGNALHLFRNLRQRWPGVAGLIVTGYPSYDNAIECAGAGIREYLAKPFKPLELLEKVARLAPSEARTSEPGAGDFDGMVGRSPVMTRLYERIGRIAPLETPVLIQGETGTGKELVARSIHRRSRRAAGPFVDVNCAAVPGTLFESDFFGHEAGAFTDARQMRRGLFERATGGTLFLDEIGELPVDGQAKLLRAIEQRQVTRLGASRSVPVDVRLVCATNVDLAAAVAKGTFRADLYWRLNGVALNVPPLRDRLADLPALADHLLRRLASEVGVRGRRLSIGAVDALLAHRWPGNIRELEGNLRAGLLTALEPEIMPPDFGLQEVQSTPADREVSICLEGFGIETNVARAVEAVERRLIASALAEHSTLAEAAHALHIDPKTLHLKRKRYGIQARGKSDDCSE